jgi:alcohol dehydrogenase class IV
VPSPRAYGLDKGRYFDALPLMADQALASGSPQNNPRVPDAQEIITIYSEIWD